MKPIVRHPGLFPLGLGVWALLWMFGLEVGWAASEPIPIARVSRKGPVDFGREVVPILKANCLACHSKSSTKGGLRLESVEEMLKGGNSGSAIVPRKGAASLLVKVAAHQVEDMVMPPKGNKAQAQNLTPQELGLIKLWIDQGAKVGAGENREVAWEPLDAGFRPSFALAVSGEGRWVAVGRGNHVDVYEAATGVHVQRLADERGAGGAAHLDLAQSLVFHPREALLASGSFREIKLWRIHPGAPVSVRERWLSGEPTATPTWGGAGFGVGDALGTVRIGAPGGAEKQPRFRAHAGAVTALALVVDGREVVTAGKDGAVRRWGVEGGKPRAEAVVGGDVTALGIPESGRWVVYGKGSGEVGVLETAASLKMVGGWNQHTGRVVAVAVVGRTNEQVVAVHADGTVVGTRLATREEVGRRLFTNGWMTAALSPDRTRLVLGGLDGTLVMVDPMTLKTVREVRGRHALQSELEERVRFAAFAGVEVDFRKGASGAATTNLNTQTERLKKAVEAVGKAKGPAVEKKAATEKGVVEVESAKKAVEMARQGLQGKTGAEEKTAKETLAKAEAGLKGAEQALAKAKEEQAKADLALSTSETEERLAGEAVQRAKGVVETAVRAEADALEVAAKALEESRAARVRAEGGWVPVIGVVFSRGGQHVATLDARGGVQVRAAATLDAVDEVVMEEGVRGVVPGVTDAQEWFFLMPHGRMKRWDRSPRISLERTLGGATQVAGNPISDRVMAMDFSPDGKQLVSGGGEPTRAGEILVWDWAAGRMSQSFTNVHVDTVLALRFSPDGRSLATAAADKFARVIESSTGKIVRQFEGHTHHVLGVAWRRDGRTLVTGGADLVVKVWDAGTGERRRNIAGFDKDVTAVRYLGYDDLLAAGAGEGKVRLLKEDGAEVRALGAGSEFVNALGISPDGSRVYASGHDAHLRVWETKTGTLLFDLGPPKPRSTLAGGAVRGRK